MTNEATKLKRILSLDGGGTWALIQVEALRRIFGEHATGWDVLRSLDLVVANSGASIVAGCLVADLLLVHLGRLFSEAKHRKAFSIAAEG